MKLLTAILALSLAALTSQGAVGVTVNISGGDNTALTLTIPQDIVFDNVSTAVPFYGFVLLDVLPGNFTGIVSDHTGTIGWNGTGTDSGSGDMGTTSGNDISTEDLVVTWLLGNAPATTSSMTLTAGVRTAIADDFGLTYPQGDGNYVIRMVDLSYNFISDPGVQVPEPATYAALGGLLALGLAAWHRRRQA